MEENLRRTMLLSRGDPMVFIERPISAALLAFAVISLLAMISPYLRSRREEVLVDD